MKILFITRKWPPAVGGMETYCMELVRELERDCDVRLHALPGKPEGGAPGAGALIAFGLATAWRVLGHGEKFDVVHGGDMAVWPLVALVSLRSPQARVALSAHGTDVAFAVRPGFTARIYQAYMWLGAVVLRRAKVVANSAATAELTRQIGFRDVAVVPLATRLTVTPQESERGRYILFAGRLVRRKGLSWFVESVLPHLPESVVLRVAGTVWDESERAALGAERVDFLGPLPPDRLAELMAGAICVVIPNISAGEGHFEGFGLIAVEAAAVGAVVFAARLDGFSESVIDGVTGRLLPPEFAPAWIEAISEAATWTAEERAAVVERARSASREHFTWERVARETLAAYGVTDSALDSGAE